MNPSYDELYYDDNESNAEIEDIEAITAEVDEYINHLNEIADLKEPRHRIFYKWQHNRICCHCILRNRRESIFNEDV